MSEQACRIIQPKYYSQFQCDPIRCQETCCQRWQILIDRETCLKYMNSENPIIQRLAPSAISLNPKAVGEEDYAMIQMNKELFCPFLNTEKLCEVVLNMGEEALSTTCRTFPRSIRKFHDRVERGLVMSCSVACELALQNKHGIEFEELTMEFDVRKHQFSDLSELEEAELENGFRLREIMIEMMKNRELDVSERVIGIGEFLMSELGENPKEGKAPESFVIQPEQQFHHLNQILSMKFNDGDSIRFFSNRYIECLMPVLDAFGRADQKEIGRFYRKGKQDYLQPYLQEKGYIIENYLVNYLFTYSHEFFDQDRLWDAYLKFAVMFGLLKFNMIGLGIAEEGLRDQAVFKLIQSLSKTLLPDLQYFHSVFSYMREEKLDDCMGISMLIMNG